MPWMAVHPKPIAKHNLHLYYTHTISDLTRVVDPQKVYVGHLTWKGALQSHEILRLLQEAWCKHELFGALPQVEFTGPALHFVRGLSLKAAFCERLPVLHKVTPNTAPVAWKSDTLTSPNTAPPATSGTPSVCHESDKSLLPLLLSAILHSFLFRFFPFLCPIPFLPFFLPRSLLPAYLPPDPLGLLFLNPY